MHLVLVDVSVSMSLVFVIFNFFIAFNSNIQNPDFLAKTLDRLPEIPNQPQNTPQIWHGVSDNNPQALHLAYRTYQTYYNDNADSTCTFISNVCNFCIFIFCVFFPYCFFHHPNQHRWLFVNINEILFLSIITCLFIIGFFLYYNPKTSLQSLSVSWLIVHLIHSSSLVLRVS